MPSPGRGVRGGIVSDFSATFLRENVTWRGLRSVGLASRVSAVGAGVNISAAGGHVQGWINRVATGSTITLASRGTSTSGFTVFSRFDTGAIEVSASNGTAYVTYAGPVALSQPQHVCLVYTGTAMVVYLNGMQVFTSTFTFVPANKATTQTTVSSGTTGDWYGTAGSDIDVPTAAEVLAAYRAGLAAGDVVAIPGKTQHLWSQKLAGASSTVPDQIGSDTLTVSTAGSPSYPTFTDVQSDSWFDASAYATAGGKVTAWVDHIDNSHLLSQATAANQCVNPTVTGNFGSAPSFTFTGAENYASNRRRALFRFLHDGAGGTAIVAHRSTGSAIFRYLVSTAGSTSTGMRMSMPGVLSARRVGTAGFGDVEAAGYANGVSTYTRWTAGSQGELARNGQAPATAALGAPLLGDPAETLTISRGSTWIGELAALFAWRRALTAPELAIAQRYLAVTMGLNA